MITIIIGNVGSGKTAIAVREMALNKTHRQTYANIKTKLKNQIDINARMIIKDEVVGSKKNKLTGKEEQVYKYSLNIDFWKSLDHKAINVVLDEAHTLINARKAMSKINTITTEWLSLIRKVLGGTEGHGELVMITQLPRRIDVIAREMSTNIMYCLCHYYKTCKKCGCMWQEHSDMPQPLWNCPMCNHWKIKKHNHVIEVWHFPNINMYDMWKMFNMKTYFKHYFVHDIENYFGLYDTFTFDNLFSEFYAQSSK